MGLYTSFCLYGRLAVSAVLPYPSESALRNKPGALTLEYRLPLCLLELKKMMARSPKVCDADINMQEAETVFCRPGAPAGFFSGGATCTWLIAPTYLLQCMHIKEKN